MKLYKMLIVLVLIALTLTGCNSSEGITQKDIGIVKVGDKNAVVQYGMSRSDAEKVLGNGEIVGKTLTTYDNGVSVVYRDEKVVAIALKEGSKESYTTTSGAKIGMSEDEITKLYSEVEPLRTPQVSMNSYHYNSETGKFLTEEDLVGLSARMLPPESDKLYVFFYMFDSLGKINGIQLSDGTYSLFYR